MGSHGTGKTRLSEGLVKAICKELGLKAVKYANLDASDINRKDPGNNYQQDGRRLSSDRESKFY